MALQEIMGRVERQEQMAVLRERLRQSPKLRYLFFELTDCCNLHCLHCGSSCGDANGQFLRKRVNH